MLLGCEATSQHTNNPVTCLLLHGQCYKWPAQYQYTVTGWGSLICSFSPSVVAVCTIVLADLSLTYALPDAGASSDQETSHSSSSAFPAMLDLQSGEYGEVHSLFQCLTWSPKLPVGIHGTGPCLASQSVEGGAGLQDVVGGLRTCAAWTFVEVGEELTVSTSQSKDCDLSCSVQLVDAVLFCPSV